MSKKIITICRSFGAEGHEIGKELSQRLNIPLYDKDLLDMAAQKSNLELNHAATLDEQISRKIISHYFLMSQDIESDRLFREETNLILQLAEKGSCIIVGRMADYILRERTDCLKVLQRLMRPVWTLSGKSMESPQKKQRKQCARWTQPEKNSTIIIPMANGDRKRIKILS